MTFNSTVILLVSVLGDKSHLLPELVQENDKNFLQE